MKDQGQTAAIFLNVKKRKQWTNEAIQATVDAVIEDHMPVLRASQLYNVLKTTLYITKSQLRKEQQQLRK